MAELTIKQLAEQRVVKLAEVNAFLDENKTDGKSESGGPIFKGGIDLEKLASFETELKSITDELEGKRRAENVHELSQKAMAEHAITNGLGTPNPSKFGANGQIATVSLGELWAERLGKQLTTTGEGKMSTVGRKTYEINIEGFDVKTLMSTTAGFAPFVPRSDIVISSPQRRPVVADLIPQDPTELAAIKYMLETTYTNNAAGTAEAGTYPESALVWTEQTSPVVKIANSLPITDEQMDDVPTLMALINGRLALMNLQREETDLVSGAGSPTLTGFLNNGGLLTQAVAGDDFFTAVQKGFMKVRTGGASAYGSAEPSGVIMHPTEYTSLITAKDTTGRFIYGDPATMSIGRSLWGVIPVVTNGISQGTMLVGDFLMFSHISRRMQFVIEVGYINDQFTKGEKSIRITQRESLEIYRGSAFCQVTGFPNLT